MVSVFKQTYSDYEFIIIDGGSTDASKEYIEQNKDKISYWVSEKDIGIYNAMNKGIQVATGDYIHFLNSGDTYHSDNTLESIFQNEQREDILCGGVINFTHERDWEIVPPDELTYIHLREHNLPHQGCFIKRELFDRVGMYNEELQIAADWEFALKAMAFQNASYKKLYSSIAVYPFDGISSRPENKGILLGERDEIINKYFSFFEPDYQKFRELKNELNKFQRSKAHQLTQKIIESRAFKSMKR